jgi:hypothetical protein
MYSNIEEAWSANPIKEMEKKLQGRESLNDLQPRITVPEAQHSLPTQASTVGINVNNETEMPQRSKQTTSESSFNPFSETEKYDPTFSPYATVISETMRKNKMLAKSKLAKKVTIDDTSDTMDTLSDLDLSSSVNSETSPKRKNQDPCRYSAKHMKTCSKCNKKLKKIINRRIKSKADDIILEYHRNQNRIPPPQEKSNSNDSLKETLILVGGALIALFIIFLIARTFMAGK